MWRYRRGGGQVKEGSVRKGRDEGTLPWPLSPPPRARLHSRGKGRGAVPQTYRSRREAQGFTPARSVPGPERRRLTEPSQALSATLQFRFPAASLWGGALPSRPARSSDAKEGAVPARQGAAQDLRLAALPSGGRLRIALR